MTRIDEILADVIKGAHQAGASVEQLTIGREQKLAGLGGAAGSLVGPLGSAAGAGLQDKNWGSAAGAGAGALLGGAAGTALGGMAGRSIGQLIDADPHLSQTVGSLLGLIGGGVVGGHMGQNAMRPEKQANHAGLGGLLGPIPAAALADKGQEWDAAKGSIGGGLLGAAGGGLLGALGGRPGLGAAIGGTAGSAYGAHRGGEAPGLLEKIRGKFSSAEDAYLAGSAHAATQYKVAIAPLIGMGLSMLAPAAARFGLGRVAGGALGKAGGGALGRMAGSAMNFAKKPVGGALFDAGTSMAAQSAMS